VVPERRTDGKYVWPIYDSFDIFTADLDGNILNQLTNEPGYDAEATVSPKGDKIVFTSLRTGDLELYTMNIDGTDLKQITSDLGYDGGAFFSPDGSKLIWRASRPTKEEDVKIYKDLLADGLVMPTSMELYIANADGSNAKKLTDLGKAKELADKISQPVYAIFIGDEIMIQGNTAANRRTSAVNNPYPKGIGA
jgi:Tol biopolymer transport system component